MALVTYRDALWPYNLIWSIRSSLRVQVSENVHAFRED